MSEVLRAAIRDGQSIRRARAALRARPAPGAAATTVIVCNDASPDQLRAMKAWLQKELRDE